MNFGARWSKIIHDIWDNKTRSLLVVFSLAIGIAAVGMISNGVRMLKRDLYGGYAQTNPASINIYVTPFKKELANDVRGLREVKRAEARRTLSAFVIDKDGEKHNLKMMVAADPDNIQINRFDVQEGAGTPGLRSILIERTAAQGLKLKVGDQITVEMSNGDRYPLTVGGIIHDMSTEYYNLSGDAFGYVSMATLEWMGEAPGYNLIKLQVAENPTDRAHVLRVAGLARDRVIEPAGYRVLSMSIFSPKGIPGDFWAKDQIDGVLLILQIMSVLAIFLSASLVVNTISAVIVQQTKQIGIMRSIGASRRQVALIYLGYVFLLSVIGLLIALPLGLAGAEALSQVAANFMNYNIGPLDLPLNLLLLQAGLALLMPVGVAMFPILRGTRVSVYDAIYQYGLISGEGRRGWIERQLVKVRNFNPPVMLSLRNTFRNKPRLSFTLVTLTIAGAMYIAVFSAYNTIQSQIRDLTRYIHFDASISIPGGASRLTAEREALRVPDVQVAEGWSITSAFIVQPGDVESDHIDIYGLPDNTRTIEPRIVAGRWLTPADTTQVVINEDLLSREPDIQVGSKIPVKINQQTRELEVVGIVSKHMTGPRIYMNERQVSKFTNRQNQVDMVRVLATPDTLGSVRRQNQISQELEKRFDDAKLSQMGGQTRDEIFSAMTSAFTILLVILVIVALILVVIGGLGLTGTMGLNVLERTREIGVLRAVGASHFSVRQVVVVEGITVALISWGISALLSYPVGKLLADALVRATLGTPATFHFSALGLFSWMLVVTLIGVFSSLAPARDAARLTVREVLSYE